MTDFQTLSSPSFAKLRSHLRLIASDMDGTLTHHEEFTPRLIQALQELRFAGIPVVVVTGRSAGWVSSLVHYLPIAGAIAENGGLWFTKADTAPHLLVDIPDLAQHRQQLAQMFAQLQGQLPQIEESTDNRYRQTYWTFDVQGLAQSDLDGLAAACAKAGWGFTYSTVQCHIKPQLQSKARALLQVLKTQFPDLTPQDIVTVGDSPNDETLFDPEAFPHSVGVANLKDYWAVLRHRPTYVTDSREAPGFLELSQALLESRCRRLAED